MDRQIGKSVASGTGYEKYIAGDREDSVQVCIDNVENENGRDMSGSFSGNSGSSSSAESRVGCKRKYANLGDARGSVSKDSEREFYVKRTNWTNYKVDQSKGNVMISSKEDFLKVMHHSNVKGYANGPIYKTGFDDLSIIDLQYLKPHYNKYADIFDERQEDTAVEIDNEAGKRDDEAGKRDDEAGKRDSALLSALESYFLRKRESDLNQEGSFLKNQSKEPCSGDPVNEKIVDDIESDLSNPDICVNDFLNLDFFSENAGYNSPRNESPLSCKGRDQRSTLMTTPFGSEILPEPILRQEPENIPDCPSNSFVGGYVLGSENFDNTSNTVGNANIVMNSSGEKITDASVSKLEKCLEIVYAQQKEMGKYIDKLEANKDLVFGRRGTSTPIDVGAQSQKTQFQNDVDYLRVLRENIKRDKQDLDEAKRDLSMREMQMVNWQKTMTADMYQIRSERLRLEEDKRQFKKDKISYQNMNKIPTDAGLNGNKIFVKIRHRIYSGDFLSEKLKTKLAHHEMIVETNIFHVAAMLIEVITSSCKPVKSLYDGIMYTMDYVQSIDYSRLFLTIQAMECKTRKCEKVNFTLGLIG